MRLISGHTLKKRVQWLRQCYGRDIWQEFHDIGLILCAGGFADTAVQIWRFLYQTDAPKRCRTVFGDSAISAVAYAMNESDISKGDPGPRNMPPNLSLEDRVRHQNAEVVARLSRNIWGSVKAPREELPKLYRLIDGRALYRKGIAKQDTRVLHKSLEEFQEFLDSNDNSIRSAEAMEGCLLSVDLALQLGKQDQALRNLNVFLDGVDHSGQFLFLTEAFGLMSVTAMICDQAILHRIKLDRNEVSALRDELFALAHAALQGPENPLPKTRWKIPIQYSQFYIEPRNAQLVTYFQDPQTTEHFDLRSGQVAVGTPGDTGLVDIRVEFATRLPDWSQATQAIVVSMDVAAEPLLFLRTVSVFDDSYPIAVPIGSYDLLIRFFETRANSKSVLDSWKVVLTFLPQGTCETGVLKQNQRTTHDA